MKLRGELLRHIHCNRSLSAGALQRRVAARVHPHPGREQLCRFILREILEPQLLTDFGRIAMDVRRLDGIHFYEDRRNKLRISPVRERLFR